ncbi:MAG: 1,4-dihydroxy-2-naphthoate polyprenyltransferase, partial [Chloroflexi bacterium]|nr:1,4-dihydroxy-2-naphthoate polyprenyltransferase [Chloroflexota bacterium]
MSPSAQLRRPGTLALFWQGARPRTLAISAVPVAVGAAAAPHLSAWRTAAAAVTALGLQVGVNYANDYFDGVRGVDTAARVGPTRLVASGLASPRAVAAAAAIA